MCVSHLCLTSQSLLCKRSQSLKDVIDQSLECVFDQSLECVFDSIGNSTGAVGFLSSGVIELPSLSSSDAECIKA